MVGAAEAAFWRSERPTGRQLSQVGFARAALAGYADRLDLVAPGQRLADNLETVDLSGHSPGTLGYRLSDVLFCGHIANVPRLQFPCPDWGHVFDVDPAAACARRRRILADLSGHEIILAELTCHSPVLVG